MLNRTQLISQAKAKIHWAESREEILEFLQSHGFGKPESEDIFHRLHRKQNADDALHRYAKNFFHKRSKRSASVDCVDRRKDSDSDANRGGFWPLSAMTSLITVLFPPNERSDFSSLAE